MRPVFIILSVLMLCACSQDGKGKSQDDDQQDKEYQVKISTDLGDIVIKLYNETPAHRDNFLSLTKDGFFDGTLFHRVINQFMIQGGDPSSKEAQPGQPVGSGGPGYTIPAEIVDGFIHRKGALAAARQGDPVNPERRSSGSQFYIVHGRTFSVEELNVLAERSGTALSELQQSVYTSVGGAPHLDNAYTVFGEVVSGLEVVDKIATTQTGAGDRPVNDIRMTVTIVE